MPEKTCSICQNTFHLHEHQKGLVFDDKLFVCEECCSDRSEQDMMEWSRSVMQKPESGMPIALWLIHEQNKNKPMFSKQK